MNTSRTILHFDASGIDTEKLAWHYLHNLKAYHDPSYWSDYLPRPDHIVFHLDDDNMHFIMGSVALYYALRELGHYDRVPADFILTTSWCDGRDDADRQFKELYKRCQTKEGITHKCLETTTKTLRELDLYEPGM